MIREFSDGVYVDETVSDDENAETSSQEEIFEPVFDDIPARPKDGPFKKKKTKNENEPDADQDDDKKEETKPKDKDPEDHSEAMCSICGANPVNEKGGVCDNHNFETNDDIKTDV